MSAREGAILELFSFLVGSAYIGSCVTVFYHRGLTHQALTIHPAIRIFVLKAGVWLTGIDPFVWVCLHRLHHQHADTENDPHSPKRHGLWGLFYMQFRSYENVQQKLAKGDPEYTALIADIGGRPTWVSRKGLPWLPGVILLLGCGASGMVLGRPLAGFCLWLGLMSHPIQGWMVNALGHSKGYRNFGTPDESKNNLFVAFLVFGEGYQNNHHAYPRNANLGHRWWEVDFGYWLCRLLTAVGIFSNHET